MISIIIPTYNRPVLLQSCLEAMTRLQYPKEHFEVVVVDDGGNVDLDPVIGALRGALSVRLVKQENTGPGGARNNGVAHATGKFIAFIDDDCSPFEDWLTVLARRLEQDSSRIYGGHTLNALESNVFTSASQSLIDYLYSYYNGDAEKARFFTANNMAMDRNLFLTSGGFDISFTEASGEDRELCDRWLHLGGGLSFVPEARILHRHELNLGSFLKQHFIYGTGAWRFRECKRLRDRVRPKLEPLVFYVNLMRHACMKKLHRPFLLSLLLVLSQVANFAGFVWAKFKELNPFASRSNHAVKANRS
ncbi:MAG TPA: glycosyltransferase [Xanthomonadales bacterium]|nr:glycosyltransferase [Xanthomonadales bacterium]